MRWAAAHFSAGSPDVRVVLTREEGFNEELRAWLPDGAVVDEVPLTTTHYLDVDDVSQSLQANPHFGSFVALVASSARCAPYVAKAHQALLDGGVVLAVGEATARALREVGVAVSAVGEGSAVTLATSLHEGPVLVLGASSPRHELREALESKGVDVVALACYETRPVTLRAFDEEALRHGEVVFIGAPSAWSVARAFVRPDAVVVVPGATTADVVRESHDNVIEGWGPDLRERLSGR